MSDYVFANADKAPISEAHDLRELRNVRRGTRCIFSGPPHCGKSQAIKSYITAQEPPFDDILVWVADPSTQEYDDFNARLITSGVDLPSPQEIEPGRKLLVVIEDCDMSSLSRRDVQALDLMLRYSCTHRGCTLFIACQSYFTLPPALRSKVDQITLWRMPNSVLQHIHRSLSCQKETFRALVLLHLKDEHDSLTFDFSGHPVRCRKNLTTALVLD